MSDANLTVIRVSGETAGFKQTETNPLFQALRITGASLTFNSETTVTNELDAMRQINDLIQVGVSSGGDIPFEYVIDNLDPLYEGAFFNPWHRTPEVIQGYAWEYGWGSGNTSRITSITSTTITLAATSVLSGTLKNAAATEFKAGHLIQNSFGKDIQLLRVSASTGTTITVSGAFASATPPSGYRVKVVGLEGAAGDITATTVGGNALLSTALDFTTLGLRVNQWVKVGETGAFAFDTSANNGYAKISAIAANRISFSIAPAGWTTDSAAAKTIRVFFGDTIQNGVTQYTFTVEQQFGLSAGTRYLYHRGQVVNTLSLTSETKSIITQSVSFTGADSIPISAVRSTGAVSLTPVSGVPLNSSTAVPMFLENNARVTAPNFVNSFSVNLDNGIRMRDAIGVLGAASMGAGRFNLTGSLSTYFGDETLYNIGFHHHHAIGETSDDIRTREWRHTLQSPGYD